MGLNSRIQIGDIQMPNNNEGTLSNCEMCKKEFVLYEKFDSLDSDATEYVCKMLNELWPVACICDDCKDIIFEKIERISDIIYAEYESLRRWIDEKKKQSGVISCQN